MAKRSLIASQQGITKAKRAFDRKGWTQSFLAAEVGLSTRQSIWKFFSGKPIDRNIFQEICFTLDLDWQEIADLPDISTDLETDKPEQSSSQHLGEEEDFLTFKQQYTERIKHQCTFLQSSVEITNPQSLDKLYTTTYFLPELTAQKWLEVSELDEANLREKSTGCAYTNDILSGVEVSKKFPKLFILGKPGAGKTTFLQYLTLQCQANQLFSDFIPILIRLHLLPFQLINLNQFDLVAVIAQQLNCTIEKSTHLLEEGKLLLLLDGLDEISAEFQAILLQKVQILSDLYHQNRVIIASRLANSKSYLRGFHYVEISEFTTTQIEDFVQKWFLTKNYTSLEQGEQQASKFLKALNLKDNQGLFELTRTPILLNFLCTIYYHRESFPSNRYKLYQAGLEILMVSWDQAKGINRKAQFYKQLSVTDKIKLLSYLAEQNFQKGQYFFEKINLLHQIGHYLVNLSDEKLEIQDPEDLQSISEEVLTSIELQHGLLVERAKGVYSFSHLTFQEYLTARRLAYMAEGKDQKEQLQKLAGHITDPAWHEVILMTSNLLADASGLLELLNEELEKLVIKRETLRKFLIFLNQKGESLNLNYKQSAIRAFYLALLCNFNYNLSAIIDVKISGDLSPELSLDLALSKIQLMTQDIVNDFTIHKLLDLTLLLDVERKYSLNPDFVDKFNQLKQQIPHSSCGKDTLEQWWTQEGCLWGEQLKKLINQYRYFNQDWQFSNTEQEILKSYYQGAEFLVKCLHSSSQIDPSFKNQLESKLITLSLGEY